MRWRATGTGGGSAGDAGSRAGGRRTREHVPVRPGAGGDRHPGSVVHAGEAVYRQCLHQAGNGVSPVQRSALGDKDRISTTIYSGDFPALNYDTIYNPEDMAKEARLAAELGPHNNYVDRYEDYLAIQEEFSFVDELYKTFLGAKESGVKNKIELLQFATWKGTDMRDVYRYLEDYDYDDTECISTVLGKLEHERHIVQGRLNDSAANLERARSFVDHW